MRSSRLPTRRARVSCPEVEPPPAHQIRRTERRSTATGPERRRTYSHVRRASRPRTLPAGYRRATSKTPSTRVRQRSHVWPVHHSKRLSGLDHSSAPPSARFFGAVRKRTGAQNVAQRQTPSAAPEADVARRVQDAAVPRAVASTSARSRPALPDSSRRGL